MEGRIYPLVDRILDGGLAEQLSQWHAVEGLSIQRICHRLLTEHAVEVSTDTVHRWIKSLGIEKAKAS